jgi:hypothetical protein
MFKLPILVTQSYRLQHNLVFLKTMIIILGKLSIRKSPDYLQRKQYHKIDILTDVKHAEKIVLKS